MHSVSIEKQKSFLLSTLIGTFPAVALPGSALFTLFLGVASEAHIKENFLSTQKF